MEYHHGVLRGAGISNLVPSVGQVQARFRGVAQGTCEEEPTMPSWVLGDLHLQSSFLLKRKLGIGKGAVMLWKEN